VAYGDGRLQTSSKKCSCRYQTCADRLGIHVSTLRYRLDRLQELFAIDLEHPDSLFGLALALRLRDLGGDPGRSGSARH